MLESISILFMDMQSPLYLQRKKSLGTGRRCCFWTGAWKRCVIKWTVPTSEWISHSTKVTKATAEDLRSRDDYKCWQDIGCLLNPAFCSHRVWRKYHNIIRGNLVSAPVRVAWICARRFENRIMEICSVPVGTTCPWWNNRILTRRPWYQGDIHISISISYSQ